MGDNFFINSFIRSEGGMPNRNGGIRKNLFTSKLKVENFDQRPN
jgi:hypothetical protein